MRSPSCWLAAQSFRECAGDIEDLAAQGQDRLVRAVARLLGRAAREFAFDDKQFRALRGIVRAVRELAGQAQLARRGLARHVLFGAAAQPLLGALDRPVEQLWRVRGRRREPMVEGVAQGAFDDARGLRPSSAGSLFWPWNSGSRMKTEISAAQPAMTSSVVIAAGALAPGRCARHGPSGRAAAPARRPASCVPPSGVGMVLQ